MSAGFCTRCGARLEHGACPRGHPQRVARARRRQRRRWPVLVVVVAFLVVAAYAGLVSYPRRAAGELMRPASADYVASLTAYRRAAKALPQSGTGARALVEGADAILDEADQARTTAARAQLALEDRSASELPVISTRTPLAEALELRDRMRSFYTAALEALGSLDGIGRYLVDLSNALPRVAEIGAELSEASGAEVAEAAEGLKPEATQLRADLRALAPPDELGSVHAALEAIARSIEERLEEVAQAAEQGASPVVQALVEDVITEAAAFREAISEAPAEALDKGLGDRLRSARSNSKRVNEGLEELAQAGVSGLTLPP
jgi:hypothetical protein